MADSFMRACRPSGRRCVLRFLLAALCVLFGWGVVPTHAGQGEAYIDAYNEIIRMVRARREVVGLSNADEKFNEKDKNDPSATLTGDETSRLISMALELYPRFVDPNAFDANESGIANAFPSVAIPEGGGLVCVPAAYMSTAQDLLISANGTLIGLPSTPGTRQMPLLWEQFEVAYEALLKLRYTRMQGSWISQGEANSRGEGGYDDGSWATAKATAQSNYNGDPASSANGEPPCLYTRGCGGACGYQGKNNYFAAIAARYAYYQITGLQETPHTAVYYNWAKAPEEQGVDAPVWDNSFDVEGIAYAQWTPWGGTTEESSSDTLVSEQLGTLDYNPTQSPGQWCAEPPSAPEEENTTSRGFEVADAVAIVEWTDLYTPEMPRRPNVEDPETDGIVSEGCDSCESSCAWHSSIEEAAREVNPKAKFPLGMSSGLYTGGLRVHAYVVEYTVGETPRQMFNLDERVVVNEYSNGAVAFGVATVFRPSGEQVIFSLHGTASGKPINARNGYRLRRVNGTYLPEFELVFPSEHQVVHRFGSVNLSEVRGVVDHRPVTIGAIAAGTCTRWGAMDSLAEPRFEVCRTDSRPTTIASPGYGYAYPTYNAGGLITSVRYTDAIAPLYTDTYRMTMESVDGKRVHTTYDSLGTSSTADDILVGQQVLDPLTDAATFKVMDPNATPAAPAKVVSVTEEYAGDQIWSRTESVVVDPDGLGASTGIVETTLQEMPWGREIVQETRGAGSADPQETFYSYYEDPDTDGDNYGHLRLVERPDGTWTRYTYDAKGRPITVTTPVGDADPWAEPGDCRAETTYYVSNAILATLSFPSDDVECVNDWRPRLVVETVAGQEVARTYTCYFADRRVTKRCTVAGAAYTATSSLVTEVRVNEFNLPDAGNDSGDGRLASISHEDGTFSVFSYSQDATSLTVTEDRGEGSTTAVTKGTRTVSVYDNGGRVVSVATRDIESNILFGDTRYEDFDRFGRHRRIRNALADAILEEKDYSCCGVSFVKDADGVATVYDDYTALQQVRSSTRLRQRTAYTYDAWGHAVQTVRSATDASIGATTNRMTYDVAGRLVASTDAAGAVTTYAYGQTPEGGAETTTTDPDGGTRIERHYRDGRLKSLSGTAATPAFYTYGAAADGSTWTKSHRGSGTNATEWVLTRQDMLGRPIATVYPDDYSVETAYDAQGRAWKQEDGLTVNLTAYNSVGEVLRQAADMNANDAIDLAGNDRISESVTAYGTYGSPAKDVRVTESRAYATASSGTYTVMAIQRQAVDGTRTWSESPPGRVTDRLTTRDRAQGVRTETVVHPDGTKTVSVYTNGLPMATIRRLADNTPIATTTQTNDAFGRVLLSTRPAANGGNLIVSNAYDVADRIVSVTETNGDFGRVYAFAYDSMGRRTQERLPDGGIVETVYDTAGHITQQSGSRTYPVRRTYDAQGRLLTLSTFRDGLAGPADVTAWSYDTQRGWLDTKTYADESAVSYTYHGDGRLATRTWARGIRTTYTYDAAGALTGIDYADATPDVAYTLDRLGRATTVSDGADATRDWTLTYTADGQPDTVGLPHVEGWSLDYGYDSAGRAESLVLKDATPAARHSLGYTYDSAGRLATVADGTRTVTYGGYGTDGSTPTTLAFGSVMTATRTYDGLNRLLSVAYTVGGVVTSATAYAYNSADQRVRATHEDGGYWDYAYDALGQVTTGTERFADGQPVGGSQFDYRYDTIGNRQTSRVFVGPETEESVYEANALNQYTERTVPGQIVAAGTAATSATVVVKAEEPPATRASRHGEYFWSVLPVDNAQTPFIGDVTATAFVADDGPPELDLTKTETHAVRIPATPEAFAYDADGNLTADGLWDYTWDGENRLIAVESLAPIPNAAKVRVEFAYDHQGRRIKKTVRNGYNGSMYTTAETTLFVYDRWNLIAELTDAPELVRTYVWGLDLSGTMQGAGGVGGLLSVTWHSPQSTSFACSDGNGNAVALADASTGELKAQYTYDPFGNVIRQAGESAAENPIRFSSKYFDPETGLGYWGYRYLCFCRGQWLNRDTVAEPWRGYSRLRHQNAGWVAGPNTYGFAGNEPVGFVDRLGDSYGNPVPNLVEQPPLSVFPRGTAGPDVTRTLSLTLLEIERTYGSWSPCKRYWRCQALNDIVSASYAWDIEPLFWEGKDGSTFRHSGGGTGDFEKTVTFEGRCYHASAANYAMWGRVNKLCNDDFGRVLSEFSLASASRLVKVWKAAMYGGAQTDEAVAFTTYGYMGTSPRSSALSGASIDPSNIAWYSVQGVPMSWHWVMWPWEIE